MPEDRRVRRRRRRPGRRRVLVEDEHAVVRARRRAPPQPPPGRTRRRRRPAPRRGGGPRRTGRCPRRGSRRPLPRRRPGLQPLDERRRRGPHHRLDDAVRPADLDEGVRLLGTGATTPARPVVVDRPRRRCRRRWRAAPTPGCRPRSPVSARPSNANAIGRARSMREPPLASRDAVTAVGAISLVERVAGQVEPAPAAGDVDPALAPRPLRVVAQEQVLDPLARRQRLRVRRVGDARLAAVAELGRVARPAMRARDQQHAMPSVRDRGGAVLVDERAGLEPLERERRGRARAVRRWRRCGP